MEGNKHPSSFSQADIQKLLQSQQGKRLLQLLRSDGGSTMGQASQAAKAGDYARAIQLLQPLMNTPDSNQILKEIQKQFG